MKLYLSGKMRGEPDHGHALFAEWREKLRAAGHDVWCPAENSAKLGLVGGDYPRDVLADLLALDIRQVALSEVVAVLPNWVHSKGARAEVAFADAVGIPVLRVEDLL